MKLNFVQKVIIFLVCFIMIAVGYSVGASMIEGGGIVLAAAVFVGLSIGLWQKRHLFR